MKCIYCGKPIKSKKDLTIGLNWVLGYFSGGSIGAVDPFHTQCFAQRNAKFSVASPYPALVLTDLPKHRKLNITLLGIMIAVYVLMIFPMILLYGLRMDWKWLVGFLILWVGFLGFVPIRNLIYLNKIQKLPEN